MRTGKHHALAISIIPFAAASAQAALTVTFVNPEH